MKPTYHLNLVEHCFAELINRPLRRSIHRGVTELEKDVRKSSRREQRPQTVRANPTADQIIDYPRWNLQPNQPPFIPKSRDIRLVAVGGECLAIAIHAGSDESYVDRRADYPALTYETVPTLSHVAEAVTAYLKCFGLSFGCFDFTETADSGEWLFPECGANAQWGWLEHDTGLPIADAITRELTGGTAGPTPTGPPLTRGEHFLTCAYMTRNSGILVCGCSSIMPHLAEMPGSAAARPASPSRVAPDAGLIR